MAIDWKISFGGDAKFRCKSRFENKSAIILRYPLNVTDDPQPRMRSIYTKGLLVIFEEDQQIEACLVIEFGIISKLASTC